ncbi:MAG: amidohydrolase family protein, partial [Terriglobales bacterium]
IQEALQEAFRIGREAKIPVEIWHLKVAGKNNWGKMSQVTSAIEQARAQGLDVTADQYPYVASATSLGAVIPPRFHEGGVDALLARLRDPAERAAIRKDLETPGGDFDNMWLGVPGPSGILVVSVLRSDLKKYEGKNLAEIAALEGKDPLDALLDLVLADRDSVGAVYFEMQEDDVRYALRQPWVSINTDYGAVSPTGPLGDSRSHPRAFGTFPRILGRYVREQKLLPLEDAIRKFTSLPAKRVGLEGRGLLRPGYFADVTIFDPETVRDVATFEDPNRDSEGIAYVLVNGILAVEQGRLTGQLGGRPLRGPGWAARAYAPDGLPPRGKIQGVVTDENGWPLPRVRLTLAGATGQVLATFDTRKNGLYEFPSDTPCPGCLLSAERAGFVSGHARVDYNGANSLWFSFALRSTK